MRLPPLDSPRWNSSLRAFGWGMSATGATILSLVLFMTYVGIGALSHGANFSLFWAMLATIFVWAGPAQIILITTLASGVGLVQSAISFSKILFCFSYFEILFSQFAKSFFISLVLDVLD